MNLTPEQVDQFEKTDDQFKPLLAKQWSARGFDIGALAGMLARVTKAAVRHVAAGFPRPPDDVIAARMAICKACPHWRSGTCSLCGCGLKAKTAWALESCPDKPSRWPQWKPLIGPTEQKILIEDLHQLTVGEPVVEKPTTLPVVRTTDSQFATVLSNDGSEPQQDEADNFHQRNRETSHSPYP